MAEYIHALNLAREKNICHILPDLPSFVTPEQLPGPCVTPALAVEIWRDVLF